MEKTLKIYDEQSGPSIAFIKSLLFIYKKYGYIFNEKDQEETLKFFIKKEFNAHFINDQCPKLVFDTKKQKMLFLIRFD